MSNHPEHEPIPQPPEHLIVGNLLEIKVAAPVQSFMALARQYGAIFQLHVAGHKTIVVSGFSLVDELCDEKRFGKSVSGLRHLRELGGDGLFTAATDEPNWRKAHSILLPNFSAQAILTYLPQMWDIAEQMLLKWERLNPNDEIDVSADMTRLTLDTIGLCGFNFRFNSFYREEPHPFVASMVRGLSEMMRRQTRLPVQDALMVREHYQFQKDQAFMNSVVDGIIKERRARGSDQAPVHDLLDSCLSGVDKQTGERLDDLNVRYQIITFLIAGHETTSGLLSFALYFLCKTPSVLARAYDEVDRVLGGDLAVMPTPAQVARLTYITQILKETLRIWPTAPIFRRAPYEDTVLGGKYAIAKGQGVMILIPMLHRDPSVWGTDAETFDPERFRPEAEQARPFNAYHPFGTGQRSCIGRQFALQEATLVLGKLLQRFEPIDYSNYQLRIKETVTLKPANFRIKVRCRTPRTIGVTSAPERAAKAEPIPVLTATTSQHNTPLLVLYGSNLGTAEGIAHRIADEAQARGFAATAAPLDEYVGRLPRTGAVVIITATYNGNPPDNAIRFCDWVSGKMLPAAALQGVNYAVFGCGNRDWATFQAVPKLIDAQLEMHGARRVYEYGAGDARGDFDGQFRAWYAPLWTTLARALSIDLAAATIPATGPRYTVEVITDPIPNQYITAYDARMLPITVNRELQQKDGSHPLERSTRHIELALPDGTTYRAGDHLGIIPRNGTALVDRVVTRFNLDTKAYIRIRSASAIKTHLPIDQPITISDLLAEYVELQDVATRPQIAVLAGYTESPTEKSGLLACAGDDRESVERYTQEVFTKRQSLLDLLEAHPTSALPFDMYLGLLPPLRPRYYSISSSPSVNARMCSITVAVVKGPARSGRGTYCGICSTFLGRQSAGSAIFGFVRDPGSPFRPPNDPSVPMIMVGAGTGLAPFRGFLQERAAARARRTTIGPSLLFFGCRHPDQDFIYEDELRAFAEQGLVTLSCAFSRVEEQPKVYVQDKIRAAGDQVWKLIKEGGVIYVCGDASTMAKDVRATFAALYRDKSGGSEQDAEAWLADLTATKRYLADVWAST